MDCFVCTQNVPNENRCYFKKLTDVALNEADLFPLHIKEDMLDRYFKAEKYGTEPFYVFSDDDVIPCTKRALWEAYEDMKAHPEIGILGLSWKRGLQKQEVSSWVIGEITPDIWEMDHVGGIMIIRRGIIKDSGERPDYGQSIGDDQVIGRIVRANGFKVALLTSQWFHHLGDGFSTVWGQR